MKLSIVTTLYCSASYIEEFYLRTTAAAHTITDDYELIFVHDGSPDNSLEIAISLYEKDSKVKIIDLSRNFGHHKAIMTGLSHAKGALIFLLDSDLEEDPELLESFYLQKEKSECDVIYGVQKNRKGDYFERVSGSIFYSIFNLLSNHQIPKNITIARLMTQRYVQALTKHEDREIYLAGLFQITGFVQIPFEFIKRHKGKSTYTIRRKLSAMTNAVTSFSTKPLILIFYFGIVILIVSIAIACYLILRKLIFGLYTPGWTSIMVSVWLLGGIITSCLGILGIYISKVFSETKRRPYSVVRKIYSQK